VTGLAASDRTSADRPPANTRMALGVALATLMLFAPGAAANGRGSANVDGEQAGYSATASRRDPAMIRGSQWAKRPGDVDGRCEPLPHCASADLADLDVRTRADLVGLAHSAGAGRLSGQSNQASSADPACEELSAAEYSLVWPSLQATVLTITPARGVCCEVSHPVRRFAARPPILPFTPRPPPA